MYSFKEVIKFNSEYFEEGDVVAVTKEDETVVVGAIMIDQTHGGTTSDNHALTLDISEKYHQKRTFIKPKEIKNIQRVN